MSRHVTSRRSTVSTSGPRCSGMGPWLSAAPLVLFLLASCAAEDEAVLCAEASRRIEACTGEAVDADECTVDTAERVLSATCEELEFMMVDSAADGFCLFFWGCGSEDDGSDDGDATTYTNDFSNNVDCGYDAEYACAWSNGTEHCLCCERGSVPYCDNSGVCWCE